MAHTAPKRQATTNPENTVHAVKRLMGQKFSAPAVQRQKDAVSYHIVAHENGDAWVLVQDKKLSPPEISSMILAESSPLCRARCVVRVAKHRTILHYSPCETPTVPYCHSEPPPPRARPAPNGSPSRPGVSPRSNRSRVPDSRITEISGYRRELPRPSR